MDGVLGFDERALEVSDVVVLAVVVSDAAVHVLPRALTDVGEVAFYEREHVLEGGGVVHVPLAADRDVYGRRVREHTSLPPVVVRHTLVVRTAAPCRNPGVAVHAESFPDLQRLVPPLDSDDATTLPSCTIWRVLMGRMLSAQASTSTVPVPESWRVSPISWPSTDKWMIGPPLRNVLPAATALHQLSYVNSVSPSLAYVR